MRGAGLDDLCFGLAPRNFHRTPFWIADGHGFAGQPETGMRRGGMLDRVARIWLAVFDANRRTEWLAAFGWNIGASALRDKPSGQATDRRSRSGTRCVSITSKNCAAIVDARLACVRNSGCRIRSVMRGRRWKRGTGSDSRIGGNPRCYWRRRCRESGCSLSNGFIGRLSKARRALSGFLQIRPPGFLVGRASGSFETRPGMVFSTTLKQTGLPLPAQWLHTRAWGLNVNTVHLRRRAAFCRGGL